VFRVEPRRPLPEGGLSDDLAVLELISCQINFDAARKADSRQNFSAKKVVQHERCNVALAARRIVGRPAIVLFRRIKTQLALMASLISESVCIGRGYNGRPCLLEKEALSLEDHAFSVRLDIAYTKRRHFK